mgnify:CR=1 FL=1
MKIWLDDLRPAPWGYESARSVNEAKTLIREAEKNGIEIEVLDLDHDLGDFANQGGDAIKLLDWLVFTVTLFALPVCAILKPFSNLSVITMSPGKPPV